LLLTRKAPLRRGFRLRFEDARHLLHPLLWGRLSPEGPASPEDLGSARSWLEASRQGTQNLVDSYTEVVPKALEVLPSEIRHRI
jgi:hypothetical protein